MMHGFVYGLSDYFVHNPIVSIVLLLAVWGASLEFVYRKGFRRGEARGITYRTRTYAASIDSKFRDIEK